LSFDGDDVTELLSGFGTVEESGRLLNISERSSFFHGLKIIAFDSMVSTG
jgi:hypothetical protein